MTSIIQFADVHFGVEDREAMAVLAQTVESLKPDVTVICGDITQHGGTDEFKAARDWIKRLPCPKVLTPGNHDTPMYGLLHRFFDPFGRYKRYIAPLGDPHFTDENVSIVPLTTARGWQLKTDWSLGIVDMEDLDLAINQLNGAAGSTVKMISVHHPLIYPPVSPLQKETERGGEALKRLSEANIDVVLSGHVHAPFVLERQPDETEIMSIGAGTLSVRRRDRPASFNHIVIDQEMINVTEVFWQDGKFSLAKPQPKKIAELKSRRIP
ncbi:MAG: metallophosphoesterase [Hellea sp.]|nr:metallophosphoesterase [Hellea sp.]